jgi:hypothetical protein
MPGAHGDSIPEEAFRKKDQNRLSRTDAGDTGSRAVIPMAFSLRLAAGNSAIRHNRTKRF